MKLDIPKWSTGQLSLAARRRSSAWPERRLRFESMSRASNLGANPVTGGCGGNQL